MSKAAPAKNPYVLIEVVESDPLRFIGFRVLFESEPDLKLAASSLEEVKTRTST